MATYTFADLASSIVTAGGLTATAAGAAETWTVARVTGTFPSLSAGQVFDVVDPAAPTELIQVTATGSSTSWTVTRGAYGTVPVAHSPGFTVRNIVTAAALVGIASLALSNQSSLDGGSSTTTYASTVDGGAAA